VAGSGNLIEIKKYKHLFLPAFYLAKRMEQSVKLAKKSSLKYMFLPAFYFAECKARGAKRSERVL
jgi:hypothetical protein